jgi:hypothetical protein
MAVKFKNRHPARFAVIDGIIRRLTSKEIAYEYGYRLGTIQEAARRMKVSFIYSGYGRRPKYNRF